MTENKMQAASCGEMRPARPGQSSIWTRLLLSFEPSLGFWTYSKVLVTDLIVNLNTDPY